MTAMLVRAVRFAPIVLLVAFTILFSTGFGRMALSSFPKVPNEVGIERLHPFDKPSEAQEFYRLKRAPVGQQFIPVERYLTANDQVKAMAQYSSATNTFTASQLSTWTQLGPGNVGGRTRALVIDPASPSTMYAAGVAGGVWKTLNGGGSWAPIGDLLPNLAVTCLALDTTSPVSARILYAGTGEIFAADGVRGAGIFKSTDSGNSWVPQNTSDMTNFPNFHYVNDIVISPNTSQTIFAATHAGIWRSINSGATWKSMLSVSGGCQDLAIRTDRNPDYILASCGTAIYRSTTGGGKDTWVSVYTEPAMGRTSLAVASSNQDVSYALASSTAPEGICNSSAYLLAVLKSTDGGSSWISTVRGPFSPSNLNTTLLSNPVFPLCFNQACYHQGFYDNVIAVDPINPNRVWAGGIDLFRSDDGGFNWGIASYWWAPPSNAHYAHADQHVIVFHPQYNGGTNKTMFVGNDGGIFRTDNALAGTGTGSGVQCDFNNPGASWVSLNNNYGVTQFYHGLPYPNGASYIGGTQDNGTLRGSDSSGINGWSTPLGGDGGYVAIDASNPSIVYAENTGKSLKKSFDGGASFPVSATNGITDPGTDFPFITPYVIDPGNSQRLWIGGRSMWRTTNGANNWVQASAPIVVPGTNPPVARGISAIAVAPMNPNRVLAGTFDGHIYRTDVALSSSSATTWNNVQIRGGVVSWISFDPADINNNIVYASVSNFNSALPTDRHIYKSTDGGVSWGGVNGWTLDIPVHCIVVDRNNSSKLYVGTDLGVFVSLDGGGAWARENTGFANAVTESLALNTVGGTTTLFAFTHGRGVWRVPVSAAPPPPPPPQGFDYVSDLNLNVITNGWGPLERDQSNGEQPAGDGRTITLNGVPYAKGLGAAASSEVRISLNGGYTTFLADVGLDDEMDPYGVVGSIVFQVWADGVNIYDSGVMNTVTATKTINVSVAGKNELRLIVTDGGDNNWYDHADWAGARLVRVSAPPAFDYLSDLNFTVITNGWGPVEKDQSLGEQPAGDGRTITLNGVQYAKGLGAAAISEVRVTLNGAYTTFVSDVGLDDEMDPYGVVGSIVFQVWADGVKIYDSGVMNTVTVTKNINVSVAGKNELRLIVTDGGDNGWYDHADWAGARLVRSSAPPPPPFDYVSDLNFNVITNGWGPVERDQSLGEQPAGDGRTITLNGVQYAKGLGAAAISEVRVTLNGAYTTFVSDVGLDDEMDPYGVVGSIVFQVWADGVKIYDSGVMNTVTATKNINVSVAGKNELRLIVTDGGDNGWYDHADWAGARLIR